MNTLNSDGRDFVDVIGVVFNNWTGLKLAIEHGTGGTPVETRRKIENLVNSVHDTLNNSGDYYDLIDELETVLDEQFCTIVEDNSCEEVSEELLNLHKLWVQRHFDDVSNRIDAFKIKESILIPLRRIGSKNTRVEMNVDSAESNIEQEEMEQDSEWTVVSKKKR